MKRFLFAFVIAGCAAESLEPAATADEAWIAVAACGRDECRGAATALGDHGLAAVSAGSKGATLSVAASHPNAARRLASRTDVHLWSQAELDTMTSVSTRRRPSAVINGCALAAKVMQPCLDLPSPSRARAHPGSEGHAVPASRASSGSTSLRHRRA
jgi:hypothetical protein